MMKVRVNPCDTWEDPLRENHNELPSHSLQEFASIPVDFASHALFLMYFIYMSHLSTKEEVLECRMEDEKSLNHRSYCTLDWLTVL